MQECKKDVSPVPCDRKSPAGSRLRDPECTEAEGRGSLRKFGKSQDAPLERCAMVHCRWTVVGVPCAPCLRADSTLFSG
jgi:hypothetical protein